MTNAALIFYKLWNEAVKKKEAENVKNDTFFSTTNLSFLWWDSADLMPDSGTESPVLKERACVSNPSQMGSTICPETAGRRHGAFLPGRGHVMWMSLIWMEALAIPSASAATLPRSLPPSLLPSFPPSHPPTEPHARRDVLINVFVTRGSLSWRLSFKVMEHVERALTAYCPFENVVTQIVFDTRIYKNVLMTA